MSNSSPALPPVQFDFQNALLPGSGVSQQQLDELLPRLQSIGQEIWQRDLAEYCQAEMVSPDRRPLDAGFMDLPDRLLAEYDADRKQSELWQILSTATRLRETVDRVVVLGIGGSYMGARALMEACCHPWHNQLTRAERGGWPRMYFEGNNVDNDCARGLLQLLARDPLESFGDGRWAIVVISKSGGTIETAAALRVFLRQLENQYGADALPELVVPVTGASGKLADLATDLGCRDRFTVPDGVGGRFSIFSPVGLLPAAILGLDIVALLRGAWLMNGHCQSAPPSENVVLNYVGVNHLAESLSSVAVRILSVWSNSLESTGLWYDQLLAESLGKQERGVLPLTVVNTRDLHSRAQQHQEGVRNKLINNLVLDSWRCDPLAIGHLEGNRDGLNELADCTWPDLMSAAIAGTNEAYASDGRPTTTIRLPAANEHSLGQLYQMLMLATVIEGRLMQINPYGQPGVEAYKQNMNRILREQPAS